MPPVTTGVTCNGGTCAVGEQCVSGVCKRPCTVDSECAGGSSCCDSFCIDTTSDRSNCGACAMACDAADMCAGGNCMPAMCTGTPGAPVDPSGVSADAGVDEDGGVVADDAPDVPVIGGNGCPPNEVCTGGAGGNVCQCGTGPGCPVGESCGTDGACMCGTGPGCSSGETCCGNACLNLQDDDQNCGACGEVCTGGSACRSGVCTCPNVTDTPCEDGCFDTSSDGDNCGACGEKCAEGATCNSGVCECETEGHITCDGRCVPGDDETNCGACGNACESPSTCRTPAGRELDCYCGNVNQVPCGGACVDLGTNGNCSECGDACAAPTDTCRANQCACANPSDVACGDSCVNLDEGKAATAPIEDCGQCGLTCLAGATCDGGKCSCPGGGPLDQFCETSPDTYQCIPTDQTGHCGGCGEACIDDSACRLDAGGDANNPADYGCVCIGTDAGKTHCGDQGCRDLDTDANNCGACGNECPGDATCVAGACECNVASKTACEFKGEAICADLQNDDRACGACGVVCGADEACCANACRGASWFNTENNCGSCDNQCGECPGFFGSDPQTCEPSGDTFTCSSC